MVTVQNVITSAKIYNGLVRAQGYSDASESKIEMYVRNKALLKVLARINNGNTAISQ